MGAWDWLWGGEPEKADYQTAPWDSGSRQSEIDRLQGIIDAWESGGRDQRPSAPSGGGGGFHNFGAAAGPASGGLLGGVDPGYLADLSKYNKGQKEYEDALKRLQQLKETSSADTGFAQHLRAVAMGQAGPSAAEQLMQRSGAAAAQRAMGMARGMRGVAPGMAARMALRSGQALSQDVASQVGQLRAQEIANAQSQYLQSEEQRRRAWALLQQIGAQQAIANAGQPGEPGMLVPLLDVAA